MMGRTKISWVPLYPEWGASSRLRVYTPHRELLKMGVDSVIGLDPTADVVVFQKQACSVVWADMDLHKRAKVIYDFDDRSHYGEAQALRDTPFVCRFTTDTEGHRMESPVWNRCAVIPDPIDFCPQEPMSLSDGEGAVWFGFYGNYPSVQPWVKELVKAGIKVRVISNAELRDTAESDGAEFVLWDMRTFTAELRKSKVAILSHYGGDIHKSNNKMLVAIAYGLGVIVSSTPEYQELAWYLGHSGRVRLDTPNDLLWRVRAVSSPPWADIHAEDQKYIWKRYHPSVIVQQWLRAFEEITG